MTRTRSLSHRFQRAAGRCKAVSRSLFVSPLSCAPSMLGMGRLRRFAPVTAHTSAVHTNGTRVVPQRLFVPLSLNYKRQRHFYFWSTLENLLRQISVSLALMLHFEILEIHKVFLRLSKLVLWQYPSLSIRKIFSSSFPFYANNHTLEVIFQWNSRTPSSPPRPTSP